SSSPNPRPPARHYGESTHRTQSSTPRQCYRRSGSPSSGPSSRPQTSYRSRRQNRSSHPACWAQHWSTSIQSISAKHTPYLPPPPPPLPFQSFFAPHPPPACTPLRRIDPSDPIVHTAPVLSTIWLAIVGTIVPSADVVPEPPPEPVVPPGVLGPTLVHVDPV